jgi:ATP adenylyltransferase
MDHLWAPWRLSYITTEKPPVADDSCFLCRGLADSDDRANLIVQRRQHCCVVLNKFPYNNGHLLVAPLRHLARLDEIPAEVAADIHAAMAEMIGLLERIIRPDGFNCGLNLGRVAGAGLPGHLHWHIVPRWNGDTNFMPVLGDTKVIVQSLDALYGLLTGS